MALDDLRIGLDGARCRATFGVALAAAALTTELDNVSVVNLDSVGTGAWSIARADGARLRREVRFLAWTRYCSERFFKYCWISARIGHAPWNRLSSGVSLRTYQRIGRYKQEK